MHSAKKRKWKKGACEKPINERYEVLNKKHQSSFRTQASFEEGEDHEKIFLVDHFIFFNIGCVFLNLGCFLLFIYLFILILVFYVVFILSNEVSSF